MDLILKISGLGFLVSVLSSILNTTGKNSFSLFVNAVGIIVALGLVIGEIGGLLKTVQTMFNLY